MTDKLIGNFCIMSVRKNMGFSNFLPVQCSSLKITKFLNNSQNVSTQTDTNSRIFETVSFRGNKFFLILTFKYFGQFDMTDPINEFYLDTFCNLCLLISFRYFFQSLNNFSSKINRFFISYVKTTIKIPQQYNVFVWGRGTQ